ncbi:guanylate kinase [Candidatus Phytoplasma melaleucae]|uniref:Guanylate kinase n=1 Tax=Candidatus Phytoplasma melaleucae TaxID=2982630 RepID=A0ABT9DFF2_9MOLU|nr:guanylate kinase ['Melaleuca sp.' phytoplasma]MDO8168131.1 guanylate kinase ['Melaleuca sp.' phytoplasma]MDV3205241.1 guanylate kinase [Weeping tea tree witches'-broom phytoplasma]
MGLCQKRILIILSGPSGVGKGTVKKALLDRPGNNFVCSISMTTRLPRTYEKPDVDYIFVSRNFFENKIKENFFLEYNEFVGNYYGTPRQKILEHLSKKKDIILEMDVQGFLQIKKNPIGKLGIFIFLIPPSKHVLYQRIKERNTESEEIIQKRVQEADQECLLAKQYDYILVNNDLKSTVDKIISIVNEAHLKCQNKINCCLSEILN